MKTNSPETKKPLIINPRLWSFIICLLFFSCFAVYSFVASAQEKALTKKTLKVTTINNDLKNYLFYGLENPEPKRIVDIEPALGYKRMPLKEAFPLWVREMPLLPKGRPVVDYAGVAVEPPARVLAVVGVPVMGSACQCADMAILLYAYFKLFAGDEDEIKFNSVSGQSMSWQKWKQGTRYVISDDGKKLIETKDKARPNINMGCEFRKFLNLVFLYASSLSLSRDLKEISAEELLPGDLYVQPPQTKGGLGHVSIIFDAIENDKGERLFLAGYGYTPAMSLFVVKPDKGLGVGGWFTHKGFKEHIKKFGPGKWRRW